MTFANSILAGVKLARQAIESENFQAGTGGWRIARNGDAEFNGVVIRADLESNNYDPGVAGWHLDQSGSAEFNDVTIRSDLQSPLLTTESFTSDDWATNIHTILYFIDQAITRSVIGNVRDDNENPIGGHFQFDDIVAYLRAYNDQGNPIVHLGLNAGTGRLQMQASTDGTSLDTELIELGAASHGYLHIQSEDWNEVTVFANSFGNLGGVWETCAYKKMPDGRLLFKGAVTRSGNIVDDAIVFTLPAGYRPANFVSMSVANLGNNSAEEPRIRVRPNGEVRILGYSSGSVSNTAFALDGVSFSLI